MLVVIEIDDNDNPEGVLRELRLTEKSRNDIATDELFDPDEDGEPLVLHTEHIEVGVARIVGTLAESLASPDVDSPLYYVESLDN